MRPSYGREGESIELWTNHLQVHVSGAQNIYRYQVDMRPKMEPKSRKVKRFFWILCDHRSFGGISVATDYAQFLLTTKPLNLGAQEQIQIDVQYFESETPGILSNIQTRVRLEQKFSMGNVLHDLSSASYAYPDKPEAVQALNVLLSDTMTKDPDVRQLGKSKHFPLNGPDTRSWDLSAGVEARGGFFVSARTSTGRLLLNVNPTCGAFYKPGTLANLIAAFESQNRFGPARERLARLTSFLHNVQVETHYLKDGARTLKCIKTIRRVPAPPPGAEHATVTNMRFPWKDPKTNVTVERTVFDHFKLG